MLNLIYEKARLNNFFFFLCLYLILMVKLPAQENDRDKNYAPSNNLNLWVVGGARKGVYSGLLLG